MSIENPNQEREDILSPEQTAEMLQKEVTMLHTAILEAVGHMNVGEDIKGHNVLRQVLTDYANLKAGE